MLAGPLFSREALTVPRQLKHFMVRSGYVGALFVLMYTAAQTTFGWQQVRNLGDIARFGELVFQVFAFVQLTLMIFFSVLFAAGNVSQEKDRRTMLLLLMTDLRDRTEKKIISVNCTNAKTWKTSSPNRAMSPRLRTCCQPNVVCAAVYIRTNSAPT